MNEGGMSQEEIDKLLAETKRGNQPKVEKSQIELIEDEKRRRELENNPLTEDDKDVLGQLANITFGTVSTALSSILNKDVSISTPEIEVISQGEIRENDSPHLLVNVNYIKGLEMENILAIKKDVALYIGDIMMMGTGEIEKDRELTEMEMSAVQEAMNQMMGTAATAMSEVFQRFVEISPPIVSLVDLGSGIEKMKENDEKIVKITFDLEIGEKVKSKLYQITSIQNAKEMAKQLSVLLKPKQPEIQNKEKVDSGPIEQNIPKNVESERLATNVVNELIKDVHVHLELIYGRTRQTLKDFLSLGQNDVIELAEEMDEPLRLYANGVLVAEGELLSVDGYYGLKVRRLL